MPCLESVSRVLAQRGTLSPAEVLCSGRKKISERGGPGHQTQLDVSPAPDRQGAPSRDRRVGI